MMPDFRHDSAKVICSVTPFGALMPADLPLFIVEPPQIVPTRGSSSLTCSPSTIMSGLGRTTAAAVASALTQPSADWSKVKLRPWVLRKPFELCTGHHNLDKSKLTPMAHASSSILPTPFLSTDSHAQNSDVKPEAASVSTAKDWPRQPRQKLNRPAQILGAPPVAPKMPTSAERSALFHSLVEMPTYIAHEEPVNVFFLMPLLNNASYVTSSTWRCDGSMPRTSAIDNPNILLSKSSMPS
mmetsp:Transcript_95381/g.274651  ORF Transcript_95381/g.274651 Transcript_95381/m.274651 type:complete len:241 (-) Transcript_95381:1166-1888(-)